MPVALAMATSETVGSRGYHQFSEPDRVMHVTAQMTLVIFVTCPPFSA